MNILVVFTYGYSLKTWVESGTLERELSIYRELQNKFDHKFTFLTYGDISDNEINIMNLGHIPQQLPCMMVGYGTLLYNLE